MQKQIGLLFFLVVLTAAAWVTYTTMNLGYYAKPPYLKLITTWNEDLRNLEHAKKLPKEWSEIREIEFNGDNSWPTQDWLAKIREQKPKPDSEGTHKPAIRPNAKGHFKLEVFLIHWIEDYRYGAVLQYHLVDLTTNNTVWELDRTYRLGFVY